VTPELRELYQEVILDHGKRPRNFRTMDAPTHHADGFNPLCGDKVHLKLVVKDGIIQEAAFQGHGCAISTASASMMTGMLKGMDLVQARELAEKVRALVSGNDDEAAAVREKVGKLSVFSGVREYPARVKCAILVWHTLKSALNNGSNEAISTE
jgi:nitrogen fixation NifU-like protein